MFNIKVLYKYTQDTHKKGWIIKKLHEWVLNIIFLIQIQYADINFILPSASRAVGDENFCVFEQVHDLQHDESSMEEILGRLYLLPRTMFKVYVELGYEEQCVL